MLAYALYVALCVALSLAAYRVGFSHGRGEKGKPAPYEKPKRSYDL